MNPASICIQRAALGQPLHRPLAAKVHHGPQVKPSRASSSTSSPAAAQTSILDIAPQGRRLSGPVASHPAGSLHTMHLAADQKPLLLAAALSSAAANFTGPGTRRQTRTISRPLSPLQTVRPTLTLINIVIYLYYTAIVSLNSPTVSHISLPFDTKCIISLTVLSVHYVKFPCGVLFTFVYCQQWNLIT